MDKEITKAAFAKKVGVSRQAINNLINSGKVKGVLENGKLNEKIAEATYYQNVRQYSSRSKDGHDEKPPGSINVSRAVKDKYEALRVKVEYEKLIETLVDKAAVERALVTISRQVRDRLLTVADRLTPVIVTLSEENQIHQAIYKEMESALNRLIDGSVDGDIDVK